MKTFGSILVTSCLLLAPDAGAGELDSEYGDKPKPVASAPAVAQAQGSELDDESPTQACFFRRRFFGYGGFGYGYPRFGYGGFGRGFGYGGFGYGYPRFGYGGFGRGFGYGGFGRGFGYGGFGRGFW